MSAVGGLAVARLTSDVMIRFDHLWRRVDDVVLVPGERDIFCPRHGGITIAVRDWWDITLDGGEVINVSSSWNTGTWPVDDELIGTPHRPLPRGWVPASTAIRSRSVPNVESDRLFRRIAFLTAPGFGATCDSRMELRSRARELRLCQVELGRRCPALGRVMVRNGLITPGELEQ